MDRHIRQYFKFPAGSINVFTLLSTSLFLAIFDRFLWPLWRTLVGKSLTPLQLISIGHARRWRVHLRANVGFLASATNGCGWNWRGISFSRASGIVLSKFPNSLRSLSSAMIALLIGVSFYLGTALVHFVRRVTNWLPNNINDGGKLDYMYWVLVGVGVINFCYYLVCAWFYKYQPTEEQMHDSNSE
ncbi:hypothetical protein Leryth_020779 [Lithospermum erythrorhizon]|uniref:Transporter n=1 Tax=Lithospermum erythrorhizon TaxID=34254 RepID=A0AAV3PJD7_LITER|nr:hypothetical protein Leryth_020779 [Lithospermum erythrorhizon]